MFPSVTPKNIGSSWHTQYRSQNVTAGIYNKKATVKFETQPRLIEFFQLYHLNIYDWHVSQVLITTMFTSMEDNR